MKAHRLWTAALLAALGAWVLVLVRTAWLCDDAYITLRTVDNLVNGYGPRWNTDERVAAFTHPLWMLLLAIPTAFTHEAYGTPIGLSILVSTAAVALLALRVAPDRPTGVAAVLTLGMSRAFVDFSTSGLENPLTYLLLVGLVWTLHQPVRGERRLARVVLWGALLGCNRLDLLLLVVPILVLELWAARGDGSGWALGLLPLIAWEACSLSYYGFPWPNTAYAKLGSGIPHAALAAQGLWYLWDTLLHDPATLPVIGVALALVMRGRDRQGKALALGILLYLAYVVWIGGDFMRGRFLAAPLFLAVLLIVRRIRRPTWAWAGTVCAVGLSLLAPGAPPSTGADWAVGPVDFVVEHGVGDERAFWFPATGLLLWRSGIPRPAHAAVTDGLALRRGGGRVASVAYCIGLLGYFAGPGVHLVDGYALADPLLARLPARPEEHWRIGHFTRALPEGYLESVGAGDPSRIADPDLARYAAALALVTRGPLWTAARWRAIWELNTGILSP